MASEETVPLINECSDNESGDEGRSLADQQNVAYSNETLQHGTVAGQLGNRHDNNYSDLYLPEIPHDKEYHLFICYSTENRDIVNPIIESLERLGVKCCHQGGKDFKPGTLVVENINKGIEKSMSVLIVVSEDSIKSPSCQHEINMAMHMKMTSGLFIIPIKIEPCDVPLELKSISYIDASNSGYCNIHYKIFDAIVDKKFDDDEINVLNGQMVCVPLLQYTSGRCSIKRFKIEISERYRQDIRDKDMQVPDCLLNKVEHFINNTIAVRYMHIFHNCVNLTCRNLAFLFAVLICILFLMLLHVQTKSEALVVSLCVMLGGSGMLCCLWITACCFLNKNNDPDSCCCSVTSRLHKHACKHVNNMLWNEINKRTYKKEKILFFYDDEQLKIMRYDTSVCKEYFKRRTKHVERLLLYKSDFETLDGYTDRLFDAYLSLNIRMLYQKCYGKPRHRTANFSKCLCFLMEDFIK